MLGRISLLSRKGKNADRYARSSDDQDLSLQIDALKSPAARRYTKIAYLDREQIDLDSASCLRRFVQMMFWWFGAWTDWGAH